MKYFIDTEFIERFHKPFFSKPRHVIDLISIGMVSGDGRKYFAISSEYRYQDASDWVKENVILPLYLSTVHGDARNQLSVHNFHHFYGQRNTEIAEELKAFCNPNNVYDYTGKARNEFYGYYCDYDWVLLCSLFGTMMSLPNGWPMYCRDLKQSLDELAEKICPFGGSFEKALDSIKDSPEYPVLTEEHSAIADAKWNKELHSFISAYTL